MFNALFSTFELCKWKISMCLEIYSKKINKISKFCVTQHPVTHCVIQWSGVIEILSFFAVCYSAKTEFLWTFYLCEIFNITRSHWNIELTGRWIYLWYVVLEKVYVQEWNNTELWSKMKPHRRGKGNSAAGRRGVSEKLYDLKNLVF